MTSLTDPPPGGPPPPQQQGFGRWMALGCFGNLVLLIALLLAIDGLPHTLRVPLLFGILFLLNGWFVGSAFHRGQHNKAVGLLVAATFTLLLASWCGTAAWRY